MKRPEIITHLFIGGNIIDSKRTSYADIVTAENLEEIVREMMEEQHKNMLRDLKSAAYDDRIPGGDAEPEEAAPDTAKSQAIDESKGLDEVILNYLSQGD